MPDLGVGEIKKKAEAFLGVAVSSPSRLGSILYGIVSKSSSDIFNHGEVLGRLMLQSGATETEVLQIRLMAGVTGFRELMQRDARTQQVDLDRYITNALRETGLNRVAILKLTADIAYGASIAMDYAAEGDNPAAGFAYVVPPSMYQEAMDDFKKRFETAMPTGNMSGLDFSKLEPLAELGIAKAKYYMGYCMLRSAKPEAESSRGLVLLHEAARAGDSDAAASLGDYYYGRDEAGSWSKAYEFYTGFGAVALNRKRREAVTGILNQKRYNKRILAYCAAFLVFLLAMVIIAPGAALYAPQRMLGALCMIAGGGALGVAVLRYRAKPYEFLYALPVILFVLWFVYMTARLLS